MSPPPTIQRPDEDDEYATAEGCAILETWNRPDDTRLSVARARVAAGATTRWHRLVDIDERYLIVAGRGRVEVGNLPPTVVQSGDLVHIPAGCRQRITNTGSDDLVFYALCTPRFVPAAYEDIDDAR
ncbi:cupin domain-containing protein [Thioalkalicoccus limnaeus]|uniref:Cupin domain-containing protein n=1 Tax=Thioalkalicoccus limnaeus TaxID=120681 RepID=A0ABV4BCN2_9GAMM